MVAERLGFEPRLEFPLNTLSKRAPSATRPSLQTEVCLFESSIFGCAPTLPSHALPASQKGLIAVAIRPNPA